MISRPIEHQAEARPLLGIDIARVRRELATGWCVLTRLGFTTAALWFLDRWLSRVVPARVVVVVGRRYQTVAPPRLESRDLEARFLSSAEVTHVAGMDTTWCPAGFAEDAVARGHRCFGLFDGSQLVYSCWFATTPTPALGGVHVSVAPGYVYGYRAQTRADRRGAGLHVAGVAAATTAMAEEGPLRGVVAYIEGRNAASLVAAKKIGDERFGAAVVWRSGRRVRAFATPGCGRVGFTIDVGPATGASPDFR
jgi:hypothetical protein